MWGFGVIMQEQLIFEAQNGNRESLAKLLYLNYELVYKYMVKFTLNRNIAEDLVQETMLRAIEKFQKYDPAKSKFSTWLVAMAQNIFIDNIRKKKREQKYITEDLPKADLFESTHEHDDSFDRVLDVLAGLSEDIRSTIVLKHYYGYSLEEISKIMSIPVGTVKSRIHNGIKVIRKELD